MPTSRNCGICGTPFERRPEASDNNRKYCGKACASEAKRRRDAARGLRRTEERIAQRPPISCGWCGESFVPKRNQRFCSEACKRKHDGKVHADKKRLKNEAKRKLKPCGWCGESFRPSRRYDTKFCSLACRAAYRNTQVESRTCPCGSRFAAVKGSAYRYCSDACRWTYGRKGLRRSQVERGKREPARYVEKSGKTDKYTFTTRVLDKTRKGVYYSESEFWSELRRFRTDLDRREPREDDHGYRAAITTYGDYTPDRGIERPLHLEG